MKLKINIILLLLLISAFVYGEMKHYHYKRVLLGIKDEWHKIILPDEIFEKLKDRSDVRIYGIKDNKSIVEAPFLLNLKTEKFFQKDVVFNVINRTKNDSGFFYTFEIPVASEVNHINLKFNEQNFDWKVKLEGSQDQLEWFTIADNYRVLSIKNQFTNYQFTQLVFPSSKFRYYKLYINSPTDPLFQSANISLDEKVDGNFNELDIKKVTVEEIKKTKQSIIWVEVNAVVPVSKLEIEVKSKFDYYRPITIKYLSDSIKTQQGWDYIYSDLYTGTLNSIERNEFKFNTTTMKKLKIIIENQDNEPLTFGSIKASGYIHELIVRFTEKATYFLTYGNSRSVRPVYDIEKFKDNIPKELSSLELGHEELIEKEPEPIVEPPIFNQNSLLVVMILIIIILGWFSIKMIRQKKEE